MGVVAGDAGAIFLDPDLFRAAQQDHGGWVDTMAEVRMTSWDGAKPCDQFQCCFSSPPSLIVDLAAQCIGQTCMILTVVHDLGRVFIHNSNGSVFCINRDIVTKVSPKKLIS